MWPNSSAGWPDWSAAEKTAADPASGLPHPALLRAMRDDRALIAGIAAYRRHPWRRDLADPPVLWQEGGSRLLDYGGDGAAGAVRAEPGQPRLCARSRPGRSMMRWLAAQGVRPLLLDWGWPGELERGFTLTDYIAGRLERALAACGGAGGAGRLLHGRAACGGRRAAPAGPASPAWRCWRRRGISTPATRSGAAKLAQLLPLLEPAMAFTGTLPVDALQTLFALLDPDGDRRQIPRLRPARPGQRPRADVRGAGGLAERRRAAGRPGGARVPGRLVRRQHPGARRLACRRPAGRTRRSCGCPCFVAVPARDRIVPPECARPLAALIPGAALHTPAPAISAWWPAPTPRRRCGGRCWTGCAGCSRLRLVGNSTA